MKDRGRIGRRTLVAGAAALWPAFALGQQQPAPRRQAPAGEPMPPVVFVHGNGDSGALWINNIWRFEANGYKRNQLFAIDFTNPSAVTHDVCLEDSSGQQVGCSSTISQSNTALSETLSSGKYTFFCSVDGHRLAGMEGTLSVK